MSGIRITQFNGALTKQRSSQSKAVPFFGNFKFYMHTEFVYDVKLIILHKNNQHLIFELTRVRFMETTEPWCGLLKDTKHLGRI